MTAGNATPAKRASLPEKPRTGRYGIYDASCAYPHAYSGGMTLAAVLFSALESIKMTLFSERARLHATGKADVAVWFGPNGGWTWLSNVPYPNVVPAIQWRSGCPRCGSLEHAACYVKLGTFNPDPPERPEQVVTPAPNAPALGIPFSPAREYVSPEEQAEFDRIGREYPYLVAAARQSTATLTQAYRIVVRDLRAKEANDAADR